MKRISLIVCFLLLAGSTSAMTIISGRPRSVTLTCQSYYSDTTIDTAAPFGSASGIDYYGELFTFTEEVQVCAIDVYIDAINGTLGATHDYYIKIFAVDGSNNATSVMGTSAKLDGDSFSVDTWVSANVGLFTFVSPVTLSASTLYAITLFVSTDGTLDDDPEHDITNYPSFGYDNNGAVDTIQGGRISFTTDGGGGLPYTGTLQDANDDMAIVIHTMQAP